LLTEVVNNVIRFIHDLIVGTETKEPI